MRGRAVRRHGDLVLVELVEDETPRSCRIAPDVPAQVSRLAATGRDHAAHERFQGLLLPVLGAEARQYLRVGLHDVRSRKPVAEFHGGSAASFGWLAATSVVRQEAVA